MRIISLFLMLILAMPVLAIEVAGVEVSDKITLGGETLTLNGAGVRSKFIVKVYVGSLYLANKQSNAQAVIDADVESRIGMQFIYSKVEKKKTVAAWNEGLKKNLDAATLASLKPRIAKFNAMFPDLHEGDHVTIDYIPGKGTEVVINGTSKGVVKGADFNRALKSIWLGKKPVTSDLKKAMLGK
ncbi:hypothetical protein BOW28_07100 [Solemya velum gill symbiont]|uniref:chalcone isomerase family protein n=1 Tax=Solemya velum gill symbiont TaxID=2340 RepID=UPI000998B396|nr:chalcone isomerase family protein [Solemya velum gill symbiont]OOZ17209.1 hypothetical protein BOW28_07100 [Solemya velum gill symbiont]OOZ26805.1 hypothetical protein BOW32_06575 [Solemya velum gill symbiont]